MPHAAEHETLVAKGFTREFVALHEQRRTGDRWLVMERHTPYVVLEEVASFSEAQRLVALMNRNAKQRSIRNGTCKMCGHVGVVYGLEEPVTCPRCYDLWGLLDPLVGRTKQWIHEMVWPEFVAIRTLYESSWITLEDAERLFLPHLPPEYSDYQRRLHRANSSYK